MRSYAFKSFFRQKNFTRLISYIVLYALIFISIIQLPSHTVTNDHDSASQGAIDYWVLNGFSFGRDIIQNIGPLGFLNYPTVYTGFLDSLKLFLNISLTLILTALILNCFKKLPRFINVLFLILTILFVSGDSSVYLLLLLLAYKLILSTRLSAIVLISIVFSILSLAKGTCFFIVISIIIINVISKVIINKNKDGLINLASYILSLIIIWIILGQNINDLYDFISGTFSFSAGANGAMAFYEPLDTQITGLISLAGYIGCILINILLIIEKVNKDRDKLILKISLLLIQTIILFVVWKHGFVRADEPHIAIFYQYLIVSILWVTFNCLFDNKIESKLRSVIAVILSFFTIIYSLIGLRVVYSTIPHIIIPIKLAEIRKKIDNITSYKKSFLELHQKLIKNIELMNLPKTKNITNGSTVAYFGIHPGPILYNNLKYISTPSTISFASWNEQIMQKDALFFQNENRSPEYLLFDLKSIDDRLPSQDSSLAQMEILYRYNVIDFEKGSLILKRVPGLDALSFKPIGQESAGMGEWVSIDKLNKNMLWVKIEVNEDIFAKITSLLYKSSAYAIEFVFENESVKHYKFIPNMAKTGFMISPLIVNNSDFAKFKGNSFYINNLKDADSGLNKVKKFRIFCFQQISNCATNYSIKYNEIIGFNPQVTAKK